MNLLSRDRELAARLMRLGYLQGLKEDNNGRRTIFSEETGQSVGAFDAYEAERWCLERELIRSQ